MKCEVRGVVRPSEETLCAVFIVRCRLVGSFSESDRVERERERERERDGARERKSASVAAHGAEEALWFDSSVAIADGGHNTAVPRACIVTVGQNA